MRQLRGPDSGRRCAGMRSTGIGSVSLVALATLTSGCSLLFVTPPAPQPHRVQRECTSSRVAPVLDTVAAGFEVVRTGYAMVAPSEVYEQLGVPRAADIAVGASLTALFVGSAIYGFVNTAECGRLQATPVIDDFPY